MARLREQEDGQSCAWEKEPAAAWTVAAEGVATLRDRKGPGRALQSPLLEAARAGHETCQNPEDTMWSEPDYLHQRPQTPTQNPPGCLLEGTRPEETVLGLSTYTKETESSKRDQLHWRRPKHQQFANSGFPIPSTTPLHFQ